MRLAIPVLAFALSWSIAQTAAGQQPEAEPPPRLGLVLAGGGARGAAHVGVLRVLEEAGIRPDVIAGTSMGAIVGGLYAAGLTPDELERTLLEIDWERVFTDDPGREQRSMRRKQLDRDFLVKRRLGFNRGGLQVPMGALQGHHLDQVLKRAVGGAVTVRNFDHLPIPFRAVATDIVTGEAVVLGHGSLIQAIRASMSVPAVFSPVTIDDKLLVDGGLSMNTPVEVAQAMGADRLIVVDLSNELLEREEIDSVFRITEQIGHLLTRRNIRESLERLDSGDVLITPELGDISSLQFQRADEAIAAGETAARAHFSALVALAIRRGPVNPPAVPRAPGVEVAFVDIVNTSQLDDEILARRIRIRPGDRLDLDQLEADLDAIHSLDVFDAVRYDVVRDPDRGTGLVIHAERRHWGPNFLQFGIALTSDFDDINDFTLGAAYTRNAINRLGGDFRVSARVGRRTGLAFDLYQPLDRRAAWFVQPRVFARREHQKLRLDGEPVTVETRQRGVRLGLGRNLGNTLQLRGDLEFSRDHSDTRNGLPERFRRRERIGELEISLLHDSLDNLNFPGHGSQVDLGWRRSLDALGADRDWQQVEFTGTAAFTRGRWSFMTRAFTGISIDDDLPLSRNWRLGGFGQLSGLPPDALLGPQAAVAAVSAYRRIGEMRFFPVYAGASLESGNVWESRSRISLDELRYAGAVFLGMDTVLGPVYLAWGRTDDGEDSVYFYLGNPFELRRR